MMKNKLSLKQRLAGWIFYHISASVPADDLIENSLDNFQDELAESLQDLYESSKYC